jgi:hypothetical protein
MEIGIRFLEMLVSIAIICSISPNYTLLTVLQASPVHSSAGYPSWMLSKKDAGEAGGGAE